MSSSLPNFDKLIQEHRHEPGYESAKVFRDVMAEAKIASENIVDSQERDAIYADVTAIVQKTIETIRNKPLPATPTAQHLRAEIEPRNRKFQ